MAKLKDANVYRAGKTARHKNLETKKVSLMSLWGTLDLGFSLASKGGGETEVQLKIGPEDFSDLASAMVLVDRERAMLVMAETLFRAVGKQSDLDSDRNKERIQEGRQSVVDAANKAYTEAPPSRNQAERLTHEMVRQLVNHLKTDDDKTQESVSATA